MVILNRDEPTKFIAVNKGSNLFLGWDFTNIFVSSDEKCLEQYTMNYHGINENEMVEVDIADLENFLENIILKTVDTSSPRKISHVIPELLWDHYVL